MTYLVALEYPQLAVAGIDSKNVGSPAVAEPPGATLTVAARRRPASRAALPVPGLLGLLVLPGSAASLTGVSGQPQTSVRTGFHMISTV